MKYGVKSDRGRIREINEDYVDLVFDGNDKPYAFIIADGMGGHNSGEIASKMAVESLSKSIKEKIRDLISCENLSIAIEQMMQQANTEVFNKSNETESNFGMGTTLIVAIYDGKLIHIGHVGDSRAYLVSKGTMNKITTDHSYIEELIRNGTIKREEAENHPKRNLITRALGCGEDMQIDGYICEVTENDIFMLCTDGLTNMIDEDTIKDMLLDSKEPQQICDELVAKANENGGDDNISVIVVKI